MSTEGTATGTATRMATGTAVGRLRLRLRLRQRGKVAPVTGAASGIGEAAAREMAAQGASVVLADRRGPEAGRVAEEITAAGGTALAVPADVTKD
ncbi:hypothetical protein GCM10009801_59440 [Streptomyces albiaxialis]|uniref:SDR family NAD(P)-dependent oxidoreductase n=1 Tax=Streptomyces albiaxialis TaxID=329523 RepID=A0ABN2WIV8_9ACTN